MDEVDAQIAAIQAELQSLRATPTPTESAAYSVGQAGFDIPAALATAGAGTIDVLSLPFTGLARALGADPETTRYFALTKELQKAKEEAAAELGVRSDTMPQEILSFVSPSPLSKAKLVSQAGTGLASYLGMKGVETVAPESPYAGLVGALLGPAAVSGVAKGATAAQQAVRPALGVALGQDEALKAAAQAEVLRQIGPEDVERLRIIQQMPELAIGTGNVPLTAAEVIQSPSLAQYQQDIGKKAGATDILNAAAQARGLELQAALERFGVTPETGDFALGLRLAAEQAQQTKTARQTQLLESLGLTEEAAAVTKTERGSALRSAIKDKMEVAERETREAWEAVPKETKLDASQTLTKILNDYNTFDQLDRADAISDVPRLARLLSQTEKYLSENKGIITVGQLQGLRRAAGRGMVDASGKNKTAGKLLSDFRENLETTGLKYFYDQSVGMPGGLPGTAKTATDLEALTKLSAAIDKTREVKQTFGQGAVGQITAVRQFKPKIETSSVIDTALKNPERAEDILSKFGRNSAEATELRLEMLTRLSKAKNPTDFLGRNKDVLKTIFGSDYNQLNKFAQQQNRPTGLEAFATISDTQIPNKIFADIKQANAFMQRFQGTELEQYARAKFIKTKLTKSGNAVANLENNKKIAQRLFGENYADLQKVLQDLELSKVPSELAKAASKGQSITSQSLTSLGAIAASRGVISLMKQGALPSSVVGGFGGGALGATVGLAAGAVLRKAGQTRETQIDTLVAELLANPTLIKLAAAPPTPENIKRLRDAQTITRAGMAAAPQGKASIQNITAEAPAESDIDEQINLLQNELNQIRSQPSATPTPTIRIGKQDVSLPVGDKYAPEDLIRAVVQTESGGKANAVSKKGARGPAQLMPATAQELGVNIDDPTQNIEGGSRYLKRLLNQFNDRKLALAAYNWGPGSVRRALDRLEKRKIKPTYENMLRYASVPDETELYVSKVLNQLT